MNQARNISIAAAIAAATALGGCASGPWLEHYRPVPGVEAATTKTGTPAGEARVARVVRMDPDQIASAPPPAGLVQIGACKFEDAVERGSSGLAELAARMGAEEVWWSTQLVGSKEVQSAVHQPVSEQSRTRGRVSEADGSRREVELETTTARWEDVPVRRVEQRWWHVARVFARERERR